MVNLISRVETITPVLAEEYLKHNTNNRQLRKNIVSYYAKQMRDGQWMLNGESIVFNEQGTLVDGQHRLAAVIESGTSVDMLVVRNADRDSFATIDSGITRKVQDTFYVKGIPNPTQVASIINRYFLLKENRSIIGNVSGQKCRRTMSRQNLLSEYSANENFWQEVVRFSMSTYAALKIMNQSEIGSYAAYLIQEKKHDRDVVYGFFEDLLKVDSPKSKMLAAYRRRLINDKMSTTHMNGVYKQQLLIKMWNYYIEGKETTCIRWIESTEGKLEFK